MRTSLKGDSVPRLENGKSVGNFHFPDRAPAPPSFRSLRSGRARSRPDRVIGATTTWVSCSSRVAAARVAHDRGRGQRR